MAKNPDLATESITFRTSPTRMLALDRIAEQTDWSITRTLNLMIDAGTAALAKDDRGVEICRDRLKAAIITADAQGAARNLITEARKRANALLPKKARQPDPDHKF